jgi:hypothetical protein
MYICMYVCMYKCMYIQYIQGPLSVQARTTNHALLLIAPATTAVYSLERSYAWPPPSLSLLYFIILLYSQKRLSSYILWSDAMENTCLLVSYLAMAVLPLLRGNFGNVFIAPFPSTGHGADHIENTSVLLAACVFECFYLATGFSGSTA